MRPRVFPAENANLYLAQHQAEVASMRPRVFPAENHADKVLAEVLDEASMRPRVFPAENALAEGAKVRAIIGLQ